MLSPLGLSFFFLDASHHQALLFPAPRSRSSSELKLWPTQAPACCYCYRRHRHEGWKIKADGERAVTVAVTLSPIATVTVFVAVDVTAAAVAVVAAVRCPCIREHIQIPHHHLRKPRSLCHQSRPAPLPAVGCRETETQALWDVQLLFGRGDGDGKMNRTIPLRVQTHGPAVT